MFCCCAAVRVTLLAVMEDVSVWLSVWGEQPAKRSAVKPPATTDATARAGVAQSRSGVRSKSVFFMITFPSVPPDSTIRHPEPGTTQRCRQSDWPGPEQG